MSLSLKRTAYHGNRARLHNSERKKSHGIRTNDLMALLHKNPEGERSTGEGALRNTFVLLSVLGPITQEPGAALGTVGPAPHLTQGLEAEVIPSHGAICWPHDTWREGGLCHKTFEAECIGILSRSKTKDLIELKFYF